MANKISNCYPRNSELACLESGVQGMSWSPNGALLAIWHTNGELSLFDRSMILKRKWKPHATGLALLQWSSCSKRLATTSLNGQGRIWDVTTAEPIASLNHKNQSIKHLRWNPLCRLLLTSSGNSIKLWSESGSLVDELCQQPSILDVCWDPANREQFAIATVESVSVWQVGKACASRLMRCDDRVERIKFHRRNSTLSCGSSQSAIHIWNFELPVNLSLVTPCGDLLGMEWNWGGQWLAFCDEFEAYLWQFENGQAFVERPTLLHGPLGCLEQFSMHPFEQLLACSTDESSIYVWRLDHLDRMTPSASYHADSDVTAIAWNPYSRDLTIGHQDGSIRSLNT